MGHKTASVGVLWLALALSSAIDVIPGRFRNHGHFVCSTWGNHHFKTFDGDFYQFPGTCSYDFASDCHNSYPEFSIHLHRTTRSHPFVDKITINIKDVVIQLKENIVVVDGGIAKTPYYISGILIHKTNEYFKVYAKIGLTVMWNKEDAVMLELDPKYKNHTCGLCGDYNGIPVFDEFLSGDHFLSPVQFGNLQNIHDPSDECTDLDETLNADHCSQYVNYSTVCEDHLRQAAFSTCHDLLSVEPFIKACVLDMCSCRQSQDSFCLCSTISEFSRQCSHAGGSPGNWRTDSFCPKKCPANMIYQESASPCKNSCSHLEINSLCEEHYMDGCVCPEGTVYDDYMDRGCVAVSECHCKHKGKIYPPGQLVNNDCNTCSCESGKWICTERFCPGVCSIEGGAHFSTFDGKAYTFHGDCYYVLSEGRTNESHHVILGELTPRSSSKRETALKSVILYMDNKQNVVNFKADGTVFLNGLEVTLPHVTASFSIIRPSDSYVIAQSTFGLQMQVQLSPIMQLYITMEKSASTHLQGLCGDFNSKETDDFKTSGGLVEATASAFANTWKIQSNCPDVSDWLDDPCSLSIEKETYARAWCSNLEKADSPFAKCHATVDPAEYVKRCRYDSCNCRDSEHCMCAALSSYVRACAAKGIILWGWRNGICDNNITSCPSSQVFLYNLTTCQPTCRSLAEGEKACPSVFTPIDGCGCPDGEFLNEKGLCVPVSKCSCYHHGEYLSPLEMISKQDELCICHNGKHVCSVHSNQTCPEGKVYHNCSRDEKEALAHRSCKTLGVEYFQSECMPGCVCPYGLLDDGAGGCVPEEQCPCVHNKDIYPHGAEITVDCNTCSCQHGRWSCTNAVCYGTCTIYGSGHYITFDEKLYDFDGECEFVAARDYCGPNHSEGNFSIITENVRCGTTGFTCSKAIKVFLGDKILKLSEKTLQEMEGQGIKHVDYVTRDVGIYLVIEARIGILLIWDRKTTLFIKVSPVYKGKLCGLCGNFDGNSQNDFKTSQMLPVTNVLEFGNSWKLNPTCPDQAELINPCKQNPHRRSWAEKQCSLIISPVFQACHSKLDPKPFYEACVTDACSCDSGGDCECFCTAVAAYAQECTKAGACVYWRTPDICPIFCDYYNPKDKCEWHYHPCGNHSVQTCRSIYNIYSKVTITYLEGCYPTCPPDRPIFDEEKRICVNKEQCGCYYNNALYEFGEEVPDYQDCQKCVCNPGKISCTAKDDYINSTTIRDGLCYVTGCKNGTITDGIIICANVTTTTTSVTSVTTTPVTTTTTTTTTTTVFRTLPQATTPYSSSTACIYEKVCQWTLWFDVSNPGMDPNGGDYETYNDIRKHYEFCSVPERIQCRAVNAPDISLEHLKQTVHCNVSYGLICENSEQKADENLWQRCYDYEIRVHCCNQECVNSTAQTTISSTATVPTTTSSIITSTVPSTTISTTTATTTTTPTTTAPTTSASFTIHPETSSTVVSTTGPTTTIQTTTSPIHLSSSSVTTTTNITSPTTYSTTATNITTTVPTTFTITSPSPTVHLSSTSTTTTQTTAVSTPASTTSITTPPIMTTTTTTPYILSSTSGTTHESNKTMTTMAISTTESINTSGCAPVCSWSPWYDVSYPSIANGGEYETYENIRKHGHHVCDKPKDIICKSKASPDTSVQKLNRRVVCDVSFGLICINNLRYDLRPCDDYKIRVLCCEVPNSCSTTSLPSTTIESITTKEYTSSNPTSGSTEPTSTTTSKTTTSIHTTTENQETTTPIHISKSSATTPFETSATSRITPTISTGCAPVCSWSPWYDVSYPSIANGGEYETYENIRKHGHHICDKPKDIICKPKASPDTSVQKLNRSVVCDVSFGLICINNLRYDLRPCDDYKIRVLCCEVPDSCSTISAPSTTTESITTKEYTTSNPTSGNTEPTSTTTSKTTPSILTTTENPETTTPTTIHMSTRSTTTPFETLATSRITPAITTGITESTTEATKSTVHTSTKPVSIPVFGTSLPTTSTLNTEVSPSTITTGCAPVCSWSPWYDVSYPSIASGGEYETYENIRKHGHHICDKPKNIICKSKANPDTSVQKLNRRVVCDVSFGLICINNLRYDLKPCDDYKIRVLCCEVPDSCSTTSAPSTTTASITTKEYTTSNPTSGSTEPTGSTTSKTTTSILTTTETVKTTATIQTTPYGTSSISSKTSVITTSCAPVCSWSQWYDVSYPTINSGGEYETYENIRNHGYHICEKPKSILCRSKSHPDKSIQELNRKVTCDVSYGLICINDLRRDLRPCHNYEIKVYCCEVPDSCSATTPASTTTEPSTPTSTTTKATSATTRKTPTPVFTTETPKPTTGTTTILKSTKLPETPVTSPTLIITPASTTQEILSTSGVTTLPTTSCAPVCSWSQWYDVSYPTINSGGEYETYENIRKHGYHICEKPKRILCRSKSHPDKSIQELNRKVTCDVSYGLICINDLRRDLRPCHNYEIKVYCCEVPDSCSATTPASTTTEISTPTSTTTKATSTTTHKTPTPVFTTETTKPTTGTTETPVTFTTSIITPASTTQEILSTSGVTTSPTTSCAPICAWSHWYDVSYPSFGSGGEFETYENIRKQGLYLCEIPLDIHCKSEPFPDVPIEHLKQQVTCDVSFGLICTNNLNDLRPCYNYQIRVYCCEVPDYCQTTAPPSHTRESLTTNSQLTSTPTSTTAKTTIKTTKTLTSGTTTTPTQTRTSETTTTTVPTTTLNISIHTPPGKTTTQRTGNQGCAPVCSWSQWYDVSYPTINSGGEYETYENIRNHGYHICEKPKSILCRSKSHPDKSIQELNRKVTCDVSYGLICINDLHRDLRPCHNYEIKVYCCEVPDSCSATTPASTTTEPTTARAQESSTTTFTTTLKTPTPVFTTETTKPTTGTTETPVTSTTSIITPASTTQEILSTSGVTTPPTTSCAPVCSWSQWYDVSYPTINSGGEYETYENIRNHGYHICEKPKSILCRSKSHPDKSIQELNRKVTCDVSYGLICINDLRRDLRPCHNYEIKVYCCEVPDSCSATTPASTTTEPSTPTSTTTKATSTTTRKTSTPVFTTENTKPTTGTTETPVTSTTSIITPASTTQEILSTSGGTTPPTTKVTTPGPSTIPELPSTMSTASGTLPVTTAVTTMSVPSTSVGTTLTTPCVCMFNGEPFPPGEIVTGASADFCYAVICNEECNIEVSDWICSTPSPTNTPAMSSSSSPTHESTVTLSTRPTTSTMTKPTSTSTITKPTLTSSQTKPTSTSTPTKAYLTSTLTKPSSVSTRTTTFTITKPSSTSTMTKPSSTSTVTKPTTTSTQTKSTSTSTLTKASSTSTLTKPSSASTLTNPASNSALTIATSTSKPTTTTVQVGSTTDNGCMFGNYREKNETWMLCNCTTATCVGNNFIEVTQIKCEPPPKITCANGQPPIPVPDDDLCCWHWECECICSGWGDPHFLTFDGTYYSFQGNCTYTLVEEIDKRIDNFGIYIDNYDCGDVDRVSCPRGIIVRHETQEIKMTRKSLDVRHSDIEVSVNGELVGVPFKKYGVKIFRSGVYHVVEIPNLGTNITFNGEDFSVKMPYRHFGNNTQGQCGTCTNSQADDCMTRSGDILSSCEVMANTWIVEDPNKPACGLMKPVTPPETKERDVPCTPSPICDLIFKLPFLKCHGTVLPEAYYQACVFDSCSVPSANMACTSLQHYAHLCGDKGICIDWRHLAPECSMNCPSQQVYNACGPALPRTCQTTQEEAAQINGDTRYTEGCFCPANTMLFSQDVNVCVSTCGCLGPDKRPRKFGEEFQLDCQDCVCREGGSGITCRKRQCGEMKPVNCDLEGFYADIQTSSNDTCCNESVCKCDSSQCSSKPPSCDLGYEVVGAVPEGHCCPVYSCVRRSVCVHGNAEYMPGSPVYSADKCQSCVCSESTNTTAGVEIECTPLICNIQCPEGFKVKRSTQNCCGECEQTHCVLSQDGLNQLLKPGENVQSDDNCTVYSCSEIRGKFITSISSFSCPPFNEDNCEPGTVTVLSNGCCKICVEKSTSCKLYEDYEYLYHNSCRSTEKVKISRCDGLCETLSIYSAAAGAMSHKCSCCQEVQSSQKRVTLQCTDGSQVEHQYINVEECNCVNTDCGTTPSLQNIHPKIPGAE